MLEIIVLVFLTKNIGRLAARKGLVARTWKVYTVAAWIGCEMGGIIISAMIVNNLMLNILFGVFCAFGGYLFLKARLEKVPDKESMDDWVSNIGNGQ